MYYNRVINDKKSFIKGGYMDILKKHLWVQILIVFLVIASLQNSVMAASIVDINASPMNAPATPSSAKKTAVNHNRTATPFEATYSNATPSEAIDISVNVRQPGYLWDAIRNHPDFTTTDDIRSLTISGSLNHQDFDYIRRNLEQLEKIDLSGIDNTELLSIFSGFVNLREVILSDRMTDIAGGTFSGCYNLTEIDLSNISYLGPDVFWGCKNLTLKDGTNLSPDLKTIDPHAFDGCVQLSRVDLSHITALDAYAFNGCENLTLAPGTNLSPDLKSIPYHAFSGCSQLSEVDLSHVVSVGDSAFEECENLTLETGTNISSMTDIGNSSFRNCKSLTNLDLSHVDLMSHRAFAGCENLTLEAGTNLSPGLSEIPYYAFQDCKKLTDVNLSSITWMGDYAFSGCENLMLESGTNLSSALNRIPKSAFENCKQLTDLDLSHVNWMFDRAFADCENLTLKAGTNLCPDLTYIPDYAFSGCKQLNGLDLSHANSLCDSAFADCTNLRSIALPKEKPYLGTNTFESVPALLLLVEDGIKYKDLKGFSPGSGYPMLFGKNAISIGEVLEVSVSPDGGNGISYQWYFNHNILPEETGKILTIPNAQKSDSGVYECEIHLGTVSQRISKAFSVNSVSNSRSDGGSSITKNIGSWMQDDVGWWYQYKDNTYLKSEWMQISGEWYYFEDSGYMKTGWLQQEGKWYWFKPDNGSMAKSAWLIYQDNWYYIGDDGAMATGWLKHDNEFYYLSQAEDSIYGHMLKNTVTPDGYTVNQEGVWIP